jgi:transcriptional regulator with XRE-family HTH domain
MQASDLRDRRLALGMTQRQLAEAFGITHPEINRWEKAGVKITARRALWLDQKLRELEARQEARS